MLCRAFRYAEFRELLLNPINKGTVIGLRFNDLPYGMFYTFSIKFYTLFYTFIDIFAYFLIDDGQAVVENLSIRTVDHSPRCPFIFINLYACTYINGLAVDGYANLDNTFLLLFTPASPVEYYLSCYHILFYCFTPLFDHCKTNVKHCVRNCLKMACFVFLYYSQI